jgi:hypothetical protein
VKALLALLAAGKLGKILLSGGSMLPQLGERLRYASEYLGLVVLLILLVFEARPASGI